MLIEPDGLGTIDNRMLKVSTFTEAVFGFLSVPERGPSSAVGASALIATAGIA